MHEKVGYYLYMVIAVILSGILPVMGNITYASAATVKISSKSITLEVGKSKTLKISGTKSKVTWKSSKKSVASVAGNGKVTAKSAGTVTITGTVGGKKYTCKVTVTDYGYSTTVESIEGCNIDIPVDWMFYTEPIAAPSPDQVDKIFRFKLKPQDAGYGNDILIITEKIGGDTPKYEDVKDIVTDQLILYINDYESLNGNEVTDIVTGDFKTNLGTACRAEFKLITDYGTFQRTVYRFYYKKLMLTFEVSETTDMGLNTVAVNLINSVR